MMPSLESLWSEQKTETGRIPILKEYEILDIKERNGLVKRKVVKLLLIEKINIG